MGSHSPNKCLMALMSVLLAHCFRLDRETFVLLIQSFGDMRV
jgi:hypothetical protein